MNNQKQAKIVVKKDRLECYLLSYDYEEKMEYWGHCWTWRNDAMTQYCNNHEPISLVRDIIDDIIALKNNGYIITYKIITEEED